MQVNPTVHNFSNLPTSVVPGTIIRVPLPEPPFTSMGMSRPDAKYFQVSKVDNGRLYGTEVVDIQDSFRSNLSDIPSTFQVIA